MSTEAIDPPTAFSLSHAEKALVGLTYDGDQPGGYPIRDRFTMADPDLSDQLSFIDAIEPYLRAHSELCRKWQGYVSDKRSTPSPYMDLRGPITAWMPKGGGRESVQTFDCEVSACAHFLWLEANWVLHRRRPSPAELDSGIDPRLGELCVDLEMTISLLRAVEEHHWADWLSSDLARIRSRDPYGLSHLLSAYGGMGSFLDLRLDPRNSHAISETGAQSLDDRLERLRESVSTLARALLNAHSSQPE